MTKRIAIIDGHPDPDPGRLCHALCDAYEAGAKAAGHEVERLTVARLDFPLLRTRADFEGPPTAPDMARAQEAIRRADHLLIVYPLWLGTMPALLKGFLEQVFRPGFAFEITAKGSVRTLLKGRSARVVITMGTPGFWYRLVMGAHSLKSLEGNILKLAGIRPVRDTVFGLADSAGEAKRARWLRKMEALGRARR